MSIYQESGYLDIRKILSYGMTFNLVVGARGIGKTYTTLETCVEDQIGFILMRRLQSVTDEINDPRFSPFIQLNRNLGWNIQPFPSTKGSAYFARAETDDKGKMTPAGPALGITTSLSTVAHMRGLGIEEWQLLIYDEFIPEPHERPLRKEGEAFDNAYETLNRNRELEGRPAMRVLGLANSNDIGNPLFVHYGLVEAAIRLQNSKNDFLLIPERGVGLFMPKNSPISKRKADTALYRMSKGKAFRDMALRNAFLIEGADSIQSVDLKGYKPIVTAGVITIYEARDSSGYYVSFHRSGNPPEYKAERIDLLRFKNQYISLWKAHLLKEIRFETYSAMKIFEEYFKVM